MSLKDLDIATESGISDLLESENWLLFRKCVRDAEIYAEWGVGLSTFFVAEQEMSKKILSIETDPRWVEKAQLASHQAQSKITVKHIDMGPTIAWGRPEGYEKISNVWSYSSAPFFDGYQPDLILVDGRFRVHCFLEALLHAKRGTKIIFDDFQNRPWYHVVQQLIAPQEVSGRQALFIVDTKFSDRRKIRRLSKSFSYVMD